MSIEPVRARRAGPVAGKKERQRKLAKERYERRAARRAQQAQRARKWTAIGIICCVVVALAVGGFFAFRGSGKPAAASPAAATPTAVPSATPGATQSAAAVTEPATHCAYASSPPAARNVGRPPAKPDFRASYQATIRTNRGKVVVDLLNSKATCTVNSFVYLARKHYFNITPCPRLSTSGGLFMLQCGDPTGTLSGGPGYAFASENLKGATYPAGTLAMANTGAPVSNGSQFFVVYKNSTLAPSYTPFGRIVRGLNIIQNVGSRGFGPPLSQAGGGKPKESVVIESVTIKKT
jgi:peptidyl-prolyl cis-trans isomerase B (cyclophilin B)